MTPEQFEKMTQFSASMALVRAMLAQRIITEDEYDQLEEAFAEQYHPPLVIMSTQEGLL